MDELDMLKDVLATPGPSSDTVRKGRGELEQLIRPTARVRAGRPGWRVAGIGLAAAAVAVAVTAAVMFTSGTPPTRCARAQHRHGAPSGSGEAVRSADAADSGRQRPAGPGRVGHLLVCPGPRGHRQRQQAVPGGKLDQAQR
jgi:hypothetical protein